MALGEKLLTEFNAGGSHEINPLGGIPQGIGANGLPNLVEEGETRMEDFIFSDRLKLDDGLIEAFNLPKKLKGKTFAEASKILNKHYDENLNSKIDMDTSKEMLERLQSANNMMKEATSPKQRSGNINAYGGHMNNKYLLGGLFGGDTNMTGNIDLVNQGNLGQSGNMASPKGGPGVGSFIGAATTGLDLLNTAKGNTSTDTTGSAISGALKGAGAGASFGPLGAGIGGVLGLGAGIIGSKKAQEEASKAQRDALHKNVNLANFRYAFGGYLDEKTAQSQGPMNYLAYGGNKNSSVYKNGGNMRKHGDPAYGFGGTYPKLKYGGNMYQDGGGGVSSLPTNVNPIMYNQIPVGELLQAPGSVNTLRPQEIISPVVFPTAETTDNLPQASLQTNYIPGRSIGSRIGTGVKRAGEFLGNNTDLLRYAPVVTNAIQLANLERPQTETRDRLTTRYDPQFVDEAGLLSQVNEGFGSTREALQSISGGDAGALRSNLIGANIGRTRALSDARLKAEELNRAERRIGQQFDLGVDRFNIGQSNLEKEIRARDIGQYETQRSKLISSLGENIGNIGLEELRKKYPERMGLLYNTDGSFNPEGYAALVSLYNRDKSKKK